MSRNLALTNRSPLIVGMVGLMLALCVGCASIPLPKTITGGDVSTQQKKRNAELIEQFDAQRDFAEFEAAKTRWTHQRDPQGCRKALETLLVRRPQHREARLLMAELCLAEDDAQAAYDQAKKALDAYPNDAPTHYTMAVTLDALGKSEEALGYYERAHRMDPRSETYAAAYETAREAARAEMAEGRTTTIDGTTTLGSNVPEIVPLGYAGVAEPTPAKRAEGTASTGFNDVARNVDSAEVAELFERGETALAGGSLAAAVELFRQAAALRPENPQIPISAAAALLRGQHPEAAVELLTPAAAQFPQSAAIRRMLGAAYYRLGNYQASQVALQQALSLDKSSALSYLLMGWTLSKLGQDEAAQTHLRQARELDPRLGVVR